MAVHNNIPITAEEIEEPSEKNWVFNLIIFLWIVK